MDLIWWLPAAVLVLGSLTLLARIRVVEREVAATSASGARLASLGEAGAVLTAAIAHTETRRSNTIDELARRSATLADRGADGTER